MAKPANESRELFMGDNMKRIDPSKFIMYFVFSMIIFLSTTFISYAASLHDPLSTKYDMHVQSSKSRAQQEIKVLNNFTFELLNITLPTHESFLFNNPHDGWIYVRISGTHKADVPAVKINNQGYELRQVGDNWETFRYLSTGQYRITVSGKMNVYSLIVRAVPELFYNRYGSEPLVLETANYSWNWLSKNVLDNYNSIIGINDPEKQEKEIKEWTEKGGRWYTQNDIPFVHNPEEAYDYLIKQHGMIHPLMHGIWIDEFVPEGNAEQYSIWYDALRRIKNESRFKDKKVYAYFGLPYKHIYDSLVKTIMENDFRLAPEFYMIEQATEEKLRSYIELKKEQMNRTALEAVVPGAAQNRIIVLGLFSQPEESCDIYPHVDYNVFLDIQFYMIANDPEFAGTRGLQGYYSPYIGEEQTRLFANLIRHYVIEEKKDRMLKDPYILTHLKNPDFTEGIAGWNISAASADSIKPLVVPELGWLQGRWEHHGTGDKVIWTKRIKNKPNLFMQEIKDLQLGRLYSLRFFTGNYQDYLQGKSRNYKHTISVKIDNGDLITKKCFQAKIKSHYDHNYKSFNRHNPYWLNYHQKIFRARATTAQLQFSDWTSTTDPGGPPEEEIIWNFIQLQPYFEEIPE